MSGREPGSGVLEHVTSHRRQSAARRFLRLLGYSLLQAVLFGVTLGWLTSARPGRSEWIEDGSAQLGPLKRAAIWLEGLELASYDWRSRQLGAVSERSDAIVPVVIDQETLSNARADARSSLAVEPWSRDTQARLFSEALDEGAVRVLVDLPMSGASPHAGPDGSHRPLADEEAARERLAAHPDRILLPVRWSLEATLPPSGRPGPAFLAALDSQPSIEPLLEHVRRLLTQGERVFVVPEGRRLTLAVGTRTREAALALIEREGRGVAQQPRPFLPSDRAHELDALGLLLELAEVRVEGIDPARLLQVQSVEPPLVPLLSADVGLGTMPLLPDPDGKVRAIPHLVAVRDNEGRRRMLPSMALAAVMAQLKTRELRYRDGHLEVGGRLRIPMDSSGFSWLQWDAAEVGDEPRGTLRRSVNAWRLISNLQDLEQGHPPRHRNGLDERTVLVTRSGTFGARPVATPVAERLPEGLVHAQAMVDLLRSGGLRRVLPRTDLLITVGLGFLGAFLALVSSRAVKSRGGVWAYLLGGVALGALHLTVARHLFVEQRLWIAVAGPLLAMGATFALTTIYAFRTERQFAELVAGTLGRYASPDVLGRVLRDVSLLKPDRRPMTVFFSDLEGFTAISETRDPEQVVELLNSYFSEMSRAVREHGGQTDKFLGDGLMAFWGAPVRTPRHALLACEAALAMRTAVSLRQDEWMKRFGTRLTFRAGLNSGQVLVGDMGTAAQSAYSVLGPVVNVASRIEREARGLGCDLLVGEETAKLAGEEFVFRPVLRLPAPEGPVTVLELVGRVSSVPPRLRALLDAWDVSWNAWSAGDFGIAQAGFERCVREFGDVPSEHYARACERLRREPVDPAWDGVLEARGRSGRG